MHFTILALILMSVVGAVAAAADLDAIAGSPPATGGLVVRVTPDSAAARAGLRAGDIVTAYNGAAVKDVKSLSDAIAASTAKRPVITCVRDGQSVAIDVAGGRLGVQLVPVEKGKVLQLRPPATDVSFDLAGLKDAPRDAWYAFHIDGKHVGFEHERVEIKSGKLVVTSEVAFETAQWGAQHFLVAITATTDARPALIESRYAAPLSETGFVCTLTPGKAGRLTVRVDDAGKTETEDVAVSPDAMADYLVSQLAAAMPLKAGTCLHYTVLTLTGESNDPAAACVGEPEEIELDGKKVSAVPVAQWVLGNKTRTAWVDPATRTVMKFDFGNNTMSVRSTKEKATAGVSNKLKARS